MEKAYIEKLKELAVKLDKSAEGLSRSNDMDDINLLCDIKYLCGFIEALEERHLIK